jgi:hypothetical protein
LNRIGQPSCGNASFTRLEGVADFDGMMNTALTITKFAQVAATNSACVTRARHVRLELIAFRKPDLRALDHRRR